MGGTELEEEACLLYTVYCIQRLSFPPVVVCTGESVSGSQLNPASLGDLHGDEYILKHHELLL